MVSSGEADGSYARVNSLSPPPPAKRTRFFKSDPTAPVVPEDSQSVVESETGVTTTLDPKDNPSSDPSVSSSPKDFRSQLEAIVGLVSNSHFLNLRDRSSENVAQAVNLFFDESWQQSQKQSGASITSPSATQEPTPSPVQATPPATLARCKSLGLYKSWKRRFLGSLQAEVYATRSGYGLIKYNERMIVMRESQAHRKSLDTVKASNKDDSIIRVGNARGTDIGRVPEQLAKFLSVLIDTKMCEFEGTCIYAEEPLRIGDYMVVQIDCYILRTAFRGLDIVPPSLESATGIREVDPHAGGHFDSVATSTPKFFNSAMETADEKIMRLRQQGLVHLFSQLNLRSELPEDLKKLGDKTNLLANLAKANEVPNDNPTTTTTTANKNNDQGEEEQDGSSDFTPEQMDAIYKRSSLLQDVHLKEVEPPDTFNMTLRSYQKRGLNWLLQRETIESTNLSQTETSSTPDSIYKEPMHPLWQEYKWPAQPEKKKSHPHTNSNNETAEDDLDTQDCFYANLYNGEISLKFPRQKKSVLGGILADEMGLGKTISTMALVHSNRYNPDTEYDQTTSSQQIKTQRKQRGDYAKHTTLIVAPMSLLSQWESEGYAASKLGSIRILVYYGTATGSLKLRKLLCGPDAEKTAPHVVITSYGTLVSEHNMLIQFRQVHKLGEDDWRDSLDLGLFNLYSVEFYRVVLDEGHTIKNRATKAAKACYNIRADRRWVLTGTPIINKLEDLFSLVKFLGVEPWNNFSFWKTFITVPFMSKDFAQAVNVVQSVMEPLLLRRTKDMKQADGTPLVSLPEKTVNIERIRLSPDEQQLYEWIFFRAQSAFNDSLSKGTAMKSYSTIMTQILRLRQACDHPSMVTKALIATQKLTDTPSAVVTTEGSLAMDSIIDQSLQELVARLESNRTSGTESDVSSYGREVMDSILKGADSECPICMTEKIPLDDQAVTECWHMACIDCLTSHIQFQLDKGEVPRCHMCRETVSMDKIYLVKRQPLNKPKDLGNGHGAISSSPPSQPKERIILKRYNPAGQSAKVRCLMGHLKATRVSSPTIKSVVFSQFTEFLDIIQAEVISEGFRCLRFDGTMNQAERAKVLEAFRNDSTVGGVMLISLKAGGVGLNLVSASQVFMMDPWWSWAVESQAIDRIHRMGQQRDVKVVRLIVEGSVEERMLKIQHRKKFLASTLGMSEDEKRAQRLEDIKSIFE